MEYNNCTSTFGVVAHPGERIAGSDEVEGSSPFGSTISSLPEFLYKYRGSGFVLEYVMGSTELSDHRFIFKCIHMITFVIKSCYN